MAVTMLKQACGPQFTFRIEGMLSDLNVARDLDGVCITCCPVSCPGFVDIRGVRNV